MTPIAAPAQALHVAVGIARLARSACRAEPGEMQVRRSIIEYVSVAAKKNSIYHKKRDNVLREKMIDENYENRENDVVYPGLEDSISKSWSFPGVGSFIEQASWEIKAEDARPLLPKGMCNIFSSAYVSWLRTEYCLTKVLL